MSQKLLNALFVGALMTTALVAGDCSVKSGAYAGISAGVSHLGGKNEYAITNPVSAGEIYGSKSNLSASSFLAGIFAGYGFKISNLWLAGEVSYRFDNLKSDKKDSYSTVNKGQYKVLSSKSSGAFGLAAHIGALVNDKTVLYAIAGLESRRFKVRFSDNTNTDFFVNANKSYRSVAFVPGVGARFSVAKNLALRTEYTCAFNRKKTLTSSGRSGGALGGAGTDTLKIKHNPTVHSFSAGVCYTF